MTTSNPSGLEEGSTASEGGKSGDGPARLAYLLLSGGEAPLRVRYVAKTTGATFFVEAPSEECARLQVEKMIGSTPIRIVSLTKEQP